MRTKWDKAFEAWMMFVLGLIVGLAIVDGSAFEIFIWFLFMVVYYGSIETMNWTDRKYPRKEETNDRTQ